MRRYEAVLSSTQVDAQNERVAKDALEDFARHINESYVRMGFEHDPRIPPGGRIAKAWVERAKNEEWLLKAEIEVWDQVDTLESLAGDGRSLALPLDPKWQFEVSYDLSAEAEFGRTFFKELAALTSPKGKPVYEAKKTIEPLAVIGISLALVAVGSIATGFLNALGADLYNALKAKLKKALASPRNREVLIVIRFCARYHDRLIGVQVIASDPKQESIDTLFESSWQQVDDAIRSLLSVQADVGEVVFEFLGGTLRMLYWLRTDCVPSVRPEVPDEVLVKKALSIAGKATRSTRKPKARNKAVQPTSPHGRPRHPRHG